MKLILRLIGLKMSILRVDAAIINPKTVKPNVYPKFSVEFSWVKRRCSYHQSYAIYSPINHPFTPSKNLYFRENFGSKFVGTDNLIFHAVCRVTDENGKNYLSGRVLGRGWGKMISSFFWGGIGQNGWMMYRFYKLERMIIEDDCNKWTNHQQRTTSTINGIVLMVREIWRLRQWDR